MHASHGRALDTPPPPLPPRFQPNQRLRTLRCRRADTPAPPPAPLRPQPSRSIPTRPHSPSERAVHARLRSGPSSPGSARLRSLLQLGFPLCRARLRDGCSGNEQSRKGVCACVCVRVCVCAYERVLCVCVSVCSPERARSVCAGGPPRFPALPMPAACSSRCDASRIPKARSHPPVRSHSRTHAHTWTRTHPRCRTLGSALRILALPGRSSSPPPPAAPASSPGDPSCTDRASRSPALPEDTPRASLLLDYSLPRRGRARNLSPAPLPDSCGFPLTPALGRVLSLLSRCYLSPTSPRSVLGLSRCLSVCLATALFRAHLPTALRCLSHSPHHSEYRLPLAVSQLPARSELRGSPRYPSALGLSQTDGDVPH